MNNSKSLTLLFHSKNLCYEIDHFTNSAVLFAILPEGRCPATLRSQQLWRPLLREHHQRFGRGVCRRQFQVQPSSRRERMCATAIGWPSPGTGGAALYRQGMGRAI